jgi:hypothetical protein
MRGTVISAMIIGGALATGACSTNDAMAPDPCAQATFDQMQCQDAVANRGYNSYGVWHPMMYAYPFAYYYGGYHSYLRGGGIVRPAGAAIYSSSYRSSGSGLSGGNGTVRGMGGSIGAAHSAGSFGT